MKREIMEMWVKALRSGRYKQGKGYLKQDDTYCCLGVLCKISGKGTFSAKGNYLGADNVLPNRVQKWAGLNSLNGELAGQAALAESNDSGKNFEQLADLIEKNWEIL